jgi:hypothetical protein
MDKKKCHRSGTGEFLARTKKKPTNLGLELCTHTVLFVGADDDMKVIKVLDDERFSLIHGGQDLLHGGVTTSLSCLPLPETLDDNNEKDQPCH